MKKKQKQITITLEDDLYNFLLEKANKEAIKPSALTKSYLIKYLRQEGLYDTNTNFKKA